MGFFFGHHKKKAGSNDSLALTDQGRSELQSALQSASPSSRVLMTLETSESSITLNELSKQSHVPAEQIQVMIKKGSIRRVLDK